LIPNFSGPAETLGQVTQPPGQYDSAGMVGPKTQISMPPSGATAASKDPLLTVNTGELLLIIPA
jgi:hypothetical protein